MDLQDLLAACRCGNQKTWRVEAAIEANKTIIWDGVEPCCVFWGFWFSEEAGQKRGLWSGRKVPEWRDVDGVDEEGVDSTEDDVVGDEQEECQFGCVIAEDAFRQIDV